MSAYVRKRDIEAVCTNEEARQYFKSKGLDYSKITEGDILVLVMMLNKEIKKSNKECETSMGTMRLSKKVDMRRKTNGSIICCYLYVNSHYFVRRECISFNHDGFIGFAGWADQENTNPILRAFIKWCDYLSDEECVEDEK